MTAYTSANVDYVFFRNEGECQDVILHLDRLDTGDTLDVTPYVHGKKVIEVEALDHAATIVNAVFASGVTTTTANSKFKTSYVVATDVITFTGGASSTDAYVILRTVPNKE